MVAEKLRAPFDPRFTDPCVQLSDAAAWRRVPQVTQAFTMSSAFLLPGQKAEFRVEELNLHLPGSGWIGLTNMRSLSTLQEESCYFDFATGCVYKQNVLLHEGQPVTLGEGDNIAVALLQSQAAVFYLNHRQVCPPIQLEMDFAYPFLNLLGALMRVGAGP